MEIEIDTVPLLFERKKRKKEEFLARVAPSKPGDPTKDPGSLDRKWPARVSLPNANGLPTPTSGHLLWQALGLLTTLCLPPPRPPLLPTPQGSSPCQALAVTHCSAPAWGPPSSNDLWMPPQAHRIVWTVPAEIPLHCGKRK